MTCPLAEGPGVTAADPCHVVGLGLVLPDQPTRPGDIFDYGDLGRVATVMFLLPIGIAHLRIEGQGKPRLRHGTCTIAELKNSPRLGRAPYADGSFLSALDCDAWASANVSPHSHT